MRGEMKEGEAGRVAGEEDAVVGEREVLVDGGDDFVTEGVDDAPAVVAPNRCEPIDKGSSVLEEWREELVAEGVDKGVEKKEGVDYDTDGGAVLDEGACIAVLDGDDDSSLEVGVADEVVFDDGDATGGGVVDTVVDARDDLTTRGVDETGEEWRLLAWLDGEEGVVDPDFAIAVGEAVDKTVDVWGDDDTVFSFEAIEVAFTGGLDAVDIEDVATASGVGVVSDVLCGAGDGEEK